MQANAVAEIVATHAIGGGELVEQGVIRRREHSARIVARDDIVGERLLG
jgi:hypothetical protein